MNIDDMLDNLSTTVDVKVVDELPTEKEEPKTGVLYLKQDKDINGDFTGSYSEYIYTGSNEWAFIDTIGYVAGPDIMISGNTISADVPKMKPVNCKNCGAPLPESGKCKYCDSIY